MTLTTNNIKFPPQLITSSSSSPSERLCQNFKKFPQDFPVALLSQERDRREVTLTLNFDHKNLVSSLLNLSGHYLQIK